MFDELFEASEENSVLDSEPMATFRVTSDVATGEVVRALGRHFGEDANRQVARLHIEEDLRYIRRPNVLRLYQSGYKGIGAGGAANLPGFPVPGGSKQFKFVCPTPGCPDSPVYVLSVTHPPKCRLHHVALQIAP